MPASSWTSFWIPWRDWTIPAQDGLLANIQQYQATLDSLAESVATLTPDEVLARYRLDVNPAIPQELVDLANNVLEISLVQSRTRAENVSIQDTAIDLHPQAALEIARQNRLDWMNERARLVDKWRLIRFYANDLRSGLDVVFSGDMTTRDDNPFKFDCPHGAAARGTAVRRAVDSAERTQHVPAIAD